MRLVIATESYYTQFSEGLADTKKNELGADRHSENGSVPIP